MEEIERGKTDKIIVGFKDRIEAMHISVPENPNYHIDTHHKLCFNSGFALPRLLPKDVPWTIEAVIPRGDFGAFKREVEFLRQYQPKPF